MSSTPMLRRRRDQQIQRRRFCFAFGNTHRFLTIQMLSFVVRNSAAKIREGWLLRCSRRLILMKVLVQLMDASLVQLVRSDTLARPAA